MGWAIFWAVIIGGATNSGWVGFFVFLLSMVYQDYSNLEKRAIARERQLLDELELERMRYPKPKKYDENMHYTGYEHLL